MLSQRGSEAAESTCVVVRLRNLCCQTGGMAKKNQNFPVDAVMNGPWLFFSSSGRSPCMNSKSLVTDFVVLITALSHHQYTSLWSGFLICRVFFSPSQVIQGSTRESRSICSGSITTCTWTVSDTTPLFESRGWKRHPMPLPSHHFDGDRGQKRRTLRDVRKRRSENKRKRGQWSQLLILTGAVFLLSTLPMLVICRTAKPASMRMKPTINVCNQRGLIQWAHTKPNIPHYGREHPDS